MEEKKGKRTEAGSCDEGYVGVASDYLFPQGNRKSGHQCQVMGKRVLEIWAEGRYEMVLRGNQESQRTGEMQWDCSLVWRTPERMKASGVDESTWQWVRTGARVQTEDWASHTELTARRSWTSDLWARLLIQGTTRIRVPNPPHGVNNLFFSEDQGRCLTTWARKILLMLYFSHQNRCVAPAPF